MLPMETRLRKKMGLWSGATTAHRQGRNHSIFDLRGAQVEYASMVFSYGLQGIPTMVGAAVFCGAGTVAGAGAEAAAGAAGAAGRAPGGGPASGTGRTLEMASR